MQLHRDSDVEETRMRGFGPELAFYECDNNDRKTLNSTRSKNVNLLLGPKLQL
ncbi:unnamed protein product [Arabidopsis lyrata]|nr:unnamed protein product [Arabidopsis lyrata]